jgi:hypothetical protein
MPLNAPSCCPFAACALQVNYNPAAVDRSNTARLMGIFNAMTTVFFAYGGHNVALEIQATIAIDDKTPTTVRPMMKGVNWTFFVTGGLAGCAAQGLLPPALAGQRAENCCGQLCTPMQLFVTGGRLAVITV